MTQIGMHFALRRFMGWTYSYTYYTGNNVAQ